MVLAYDGGPGTPAAIPWLRERYGAEVATVTLDLGRGEELEAVRDRALAAGASRAHVLDAREELAHDFIMPALQAGAMYPDRLSLATALGRPLLARKMVEIAEIEQAGAVAHLCANEGKEAVRLERAVRALAPSLAVLAPSREVQTMDAGAPARATADRRPTTASAKGRFGIHDNLRGRSIGCGSPEDPRAEPPENVCRLTRHPMRAPDEPACVELSFERGAPTSINGIAMPIVELITSLGTIAGAHGVGCIDMGKHRVLGIEPREIHEAPATVLLHAAHQALQKLVVPPDLERFSRTVSLQYADLIDNGLWFTPLREALDAFVGRVQHRVSGTIRMTLFKGDCRVVECRSPHALYDQGSAPCGDGGTIDRPAAAGFAKFGGLPVELSAPKSPARRRRPAAARA
ncbi:MAG: argininosuccinate synthase [Acidobacteria bacterium]|nr:argininosuccinate synthase [Acidobacteriota bacterium]